MNWLVRNTELLRLSWNEIYSIEVQIKVVLVLILVLKGRWVGVCCNVVVYLVIIVNGVLKKIEIEVLIKEIRASAVILEIVLVEIHGVVDDWCIIGITVNITVNIDISIGIIGADTV